MADNVVWLIGERNSRRFFNAEKSYFDDKITFGSFYPAKLDCEHILNNIIGRSSRYRYEIVEAEVLRFDGRELIVAYDDTFRDDSLQNNSLY